MKIHLVKNFTFDSAHILEGDQGGYGVMHGHTWRGEVHCEGTDNDLEGGILVDFRNIEKTIKEIDHCFLNERLKDLGHPILVCVRPTAEHIAMLLLKAIPRATKIVLWESPDNRVEVTHS